MKLLENVIKPREPRLLSWLSFIKSICSRNKHCNTCPFGTEYRGAYICEVLGTHPPANIPYKWKLAHSDSLEKPISLSFLNDIVWTFSGNPIPYYKDNMNETSK